MIKNPISLARLILDQTNVPLSLRRIPPNILVSSGARRFAQEHGMRIVPNEKLISDGARARFDRWRHELYRAEAAALSTHRTTISGTSGTLPSARQGKRPNTPESPANAGQAASTQKRERSTHAETDAYEGRQPESDHPRDFLAETSDKDATAEQQSEPRSVSRAHSDEASDGVVGPDRQGQTYVADSAFWPSRMATPPPKRLKMDVNEQATRRRSSRDSGDGTGQVLPLRTSPCTRSTPPPAEEPHTSVEVDDDEATDIISDTVGAIAVDFQGNIAAGSSSGGIGMKHCGRIGPAALVGIGTAVLPADPRDKMGTSVAAVTSGTGEHMATTMASHTCAERLYHNMRLDAGGSPVAEYDEDVLMKTFVLDAFMDHPGVKNQVSGGAIGVMAVKKTCKGVYFYFAHNTDSFALASLSSNEKDPLVVMSRLGSRESVARGGRKIKNT